MLVLRDLSANWATWLSSVGAYSADEVERWSGTSDEFADFYFDLRWTIEEFVSPPSSSDEAIMRLVNAFIPTIYCPWQ
jgi:hypothetical protein